MMQPLISVIVPCYNVEEYLPECVESVLNQTYTNWELILVDDGSKDRTPQLCDGYAAKDERVKVIHKRNGGLAAARNTGLEAVTGEWHMYLDGDDRMEPQACERLVEITGRYKDLNLVFWNVRQDLNGKMIEGKWEWPCQDKEHLYEDDDCRELARHTMIYKSGLTTAYAKLIRTEWAKARGICHDRRLRQGEEGVEFTLRMFYNARRVLFVKEYWNIYRYTEGSISKRINEKNTQYITDCFKVMEEDIEKFENRDAVRRMLYQRVVYALIAMAMSTYFHPANKDTLGTKVRKFSGIIDGTPLYKESVSKAPLDYMDKFRVIALYCMKCRMYILLHFISLAKQYMLKRGKFNY